MTTIAVKPNTERMRKWRAANPERNKEADARSRASRREARNEASRKSYAADPDKHWAKHLRRKYKITPQQYADLLARQDGVCAICRRVSIGRLHVDHCHDTGVVRGLLCLLCNTGIGKLQHCPTTLLAAAAYLGGPTPSLH